ncbi:leader peptidase (prepilin peptidase) / N-methyltransferase [Arthrobacter alpinus]|uniref:Leader peptidase (Prepilin peptidase) / N-methyltransferase n=1 Tax=Arthrobacter alpinus TaxID=656366 RepID=A0A1H5KM79_9MICC|nr:A24 family peptidase [Arthrobacter alpinus]SEE65790.1 leader peptidase (prepilin peptidase) / N-methyltransferase [Arthrobacter alpinus]
MINALRDLWNETPVAFWLVLIAGLYYLVMATWLTVIDIKHQLLPNRIVFPSAAIAGVLLLSASLVMLDGATALRTILGAVVLWVAYAVLRLISPSSMGYGDVKLAFVLGLYLGFVSWQAVMWGTVLAFFLGAVWGLVLIVSRRGTGKTQIPFGPFMLAGALVVLVIG